MKTNCKSFSQPAEATTFIIAHPKFGVHQSYCIQHWFRLSIKFGGKALIWIILPSICSILKRSNRVQDQLQTIEKLWNPNIQLTALTRKLTLSLCETLYLFFTNRGHIAEFSEHITSILYKLTQLSHFAVALYLFGNAQKIQINILT